MGGGTPLDVAVGVVFVGGNAGVHDRPASVYREFERERVGMGVAGLVVRSDGGRVEEYNRALVAGGSDCAQLIFRPWRWLRITHLGEANVQQTSRAKVGVVAGSIVVSRDSFAPRRVHQSTSQWLERRVSPRAAS